ncbi:MAG TPA: hypothetical protein VD767_05470, partial [Thermomicrobiales bacterium]|nr:hypothetical protein [Thermomicrobiales bacterium]
MKHTSLANLIGWFLVLTVLLTAVIPESLAIAQVATPASDGSDCLVVEEPNDQPADAIDLGAGEACASAEHDNPSQDLYTWTVADGTESTWSFSLSGIPATIGMIEIFSVQVDDAGTLTGSTKLVSVASQPSQPVSTSGLLFTPGEYYIGIATSGPGPYEFRIGAGDPLPDAVPSNGDAVPVDATFAVSGSIETADIPLAWTIDAAGASTHFDLEVQGPAGSSLVWSLVGEDGTTLFSSNLAVDGTSLRPAIGLQPGSYTILLDNPGGTLLTWIARSIPSTERAPDLEDEPNDQASFANPITFDGDSASVSGALDAHPS